MSKTACRKKILVVILAYRINDLFFFLLQSKSAQIIETPILKPLMLVKDNKSTVQQNHLYKTANKEMLAGYNLVHIRKPERDVSWEAGLRLEE